MSNGEVLDRQTLDFAARVLQNLPKLSSEEMQYLIDRPAELKQRLLALAVKTGSFSPYGFTETTLFHPVETLVASGEGVLDGEKTMSNGKVLDKQTLDLAARVLQNLPKLSSEEMQYLIDRPAELKQRLLALAVKTGSFSPYGFTETTLFHPVETLVASGEGVLDEDAFFQSREGDIWVSSSFRERFRRTFRESRASNRKYVAYELKQGASDTAIRADLPKRHLSTLGDIARLIKGGSLSRDHVYLAYVEDENKLVYAVSVVWSPADPECRVNVWRLGELGALPAGVRVLCPSNATL